ncbi:MAG: ABC transporter permease subunit [Oscillospiraceae bacterium]|jgi:putative aldouronate transport system permease protein|nr:ABC transporter permease subunit [Oscillospiraceae bacterium]
MSQQKLLRKRAAFKEFLLVSPFVALVLVFSYYPLYGWIYSFFDYNPPKPFSWDSYVGLKWFKFMFQNPSYLRQTLQVLRNTFGMSGIALAFSWLPMFFAVFLNEIRSLRYKKFVQTVTTIPNFISWVLIYSVAFLLMSNNGLFNSLLMSLGLTDAPIDFMKSGEHVWFRMWLWLTWKNLGWAAIMYIAAISGISPDLYEAAKVDGATRLRCIWHITLPGLLPTFFVMLLMNISNLLNNGMEQYFVFQNAWNREYIQVLDLYVYNISTSRPPVYSVSTALSMLKSIVSLVLLFSANTASKLLRGESIV